MKQSCFAVAATQVAVQGGLVLLLMSQVVLGQSFIAIDFEEFEACPGCPGSGVVCADKETAFLASKGIAEMIIEGPSGVSGPRVQTSCFELPFWFTGTSGSNFFLQGSTTPQPHSLTLIFSQPLLRFDFSRISTEGGGSSTPKWQAEALDAAGGVLSRAGETNYGVRAFAQYYSLRAPAGKSISSVRITSDNCCAGGNVPWSTFNSIPLDDFELYPSPQVPTFPSSFYLYLLAGGLLAIGIRLARGRYRWPPFGGRTDHRCGPPR